MISNSNYVWIFCDIINDLEGTIGKLYMYFVNLQIFAVGRPRCGAERMSNVPRDAMSYVDPDTGYTMLPGSQRPDGTWRKPRRSVRCYWGCWGVCNCMFLQGKRRIHASRRGSLVRVQRQGHCQGSWGRIHSWSVSLASIKLGILLHQ